MLFLNGNFQLDSACSRWHSKVRRPLATSAQDWNQPYLAELFGLGKIYISQLENGRKQACIRTIDVLAQSFKISISEFMKGL
jgi:DNA-binding XRE family transcriptional regulator